MRLVVGAVIVDSLAQPTRVLAARRTRPAELAGSWEFPGGKVEDGESPEAALVREVREELSAQIRVGPELTDAGRAWPISERHELRLWLAEVVAGEPTPGSDHDEVRWLTADALGDAAWLPSDLRAIPQVASSMRLAGE